MADYVSQFEISDLYSQINYKGQPVRVSPLNYADFFKWWANKDGGIPAYVIVNMSTQDTEIVRLENPIRYSDSDPFFYNVDRHMQLSYPFYMSMRNRSRSTMMVNRSGSIPFKSVRSVCSAARPSNVLCSATLQPVNVKTSL